MLDVESGLSQLCRLRLDPMARRCLANALRAKLQVGLGGDIFRLVERGACFFAHAPSVRLLSEE